MRMYLKRKNNFIFNKTTLKNNIKNQFTMKNLKIFLISFFIISLIIGVVLYISFDSNNKDLINKNVKDYFIIKESYDYLAIFKDVALNNIINIVLIWLFGISVIGIIFVLFISSSEMISLGITLSSMVKIYNIKSIISMFTYLFPSKLLYIVTLFISCISSCILSYKMIQKFFFKKDIKIEIYLKKYVKILLILIIFCIVYSILEVFISPLMIKLFTFFVK